MAGVALYFSQQKHSSWLKIMTYEYIILSVGCVITWINMGSLWTKFPWFGMKLFRCFTYAQYILFLLSVLEFCSAICGLCTT